MDFLGEVVLLQRHPETFRRLIKRLYGRMGDVPAPVS